MRTLFLFVSLFLFNTLCFSQENDTTSYSLQKPKDLKKWTVRSYVFSNSYIVKNKFPNFFTGIGVKRNFNFLSIRFSYENILNKNNINYGNYHQLEFIQEHAFKLGGAFKRRYFDVIDLNIFADFIVNKYDGENILDSNIVIIKKRKFDGLAVGATIGISFDYFITPRFSLEYETRVDFLSNKLDYELIEYNNTIENFSQNFSIIDLNIFGNFSLNYHF